MRLALGGALRIDADFLEQGVDLGPLLGGVAALPDRQGLHDDVADLAPRVERRDRILEDHLHPGARFTHGVAAHLGELASFEDDRPAGRPRQLHDRPAGGALSAARLADDTRASRRAARRG